MSDNAHNMLLQWLHLEEIGMIDENDEDEVSNDTDVSEIQWIKHNYSVKYYPCWESCIHMVPD